MNGDPLVELSGHPPPPWYERELRALDSRITRADRRHSEALATIREDLAEVRRAIDKLDSRVDGVRDRTGPIPTLKSPSNGVKATDLAALKRDVEEHGARVLSSVKEILAPAVAMADTKPPSAASWPAFLDSRFSQILVGAVALVLFIAAALGMPPLLEFVLRVLGVP